MENYESKIKKITLGIRFERAYRLLDNWGVIVDNLLNVEESFFDESFFPQITSKNDFEKMLINSNTDDYLKITPHDLIFSYNFRNSDGFQEKFKWFQKVVKKEIIENIIEKFSLENFKRVGLVFEHYFDTNSEIEKIVNTLFNTDIIEPKDIRFSARTPANIQIMLDKSKTDYINRIFTIANDDKDNNIISFDYQYYFEPKIKDFSLFNMDKFFKASITSLNQSIYSLVSEEDDNA